MSTRNSISTDEHPQMEHDEPIGSELSLSIVADKKSKSEKTKKRYKLLLACEICGGDAHGRRDRCFHRTNVFKVSGSNRLQFRRDFLRILQGILSSECFEDTGNYLTRTEGNTSRVSLCVV